eukprot:3172344-Prymnesium_polylepis.1
MALHVAPQGARSCGAASRHARQVAEAWTRFAGSNWLSTRQTNSSHSSAAMPHRRQPAAAVPPSSRRRPR